MEKDVRNFIRTTLFSGSGDAERRDIRDEDGPSLGAVSPRPEVAPEVLPKWISEADVDAYAAEFQKGGLRGPLNWYRNIDRNWELLAPWTGAKVEVPALYVAGDRDLVLAFRGMDQLLANLKNVIPKLEETIILPGCGHWTQQERPEEVNTALLAFLKKQHIARGITTCSFW